MPRPATQLEIALDEKARERLHERVRRVLRAGCSDLANRTGGRYVGIADRACRSKRRFSDR